MSTLFAAFLGYDPVRHLLGAHVLSQLSVAQQHALAARSFFPGLVSSPFDAGLHAAFDFAIVASLLAAWASWLRGGRYVYSEPEPEPTAQRDRHHRGTGDREGAPRATPVTADGSVGRPADSSTRGDRA